jgi:hypothetical protein
MGSPKDSGRTKMISNQGLYNNGRLKHCTVIWERRVLFRVVRVFRGFKKFRWMNVREATGGQSGTLRRETMNLNLAVEMNREIREPRRNQK